VLADYTPPLDPTIDKGLKEYVAKRKAEGGVPGY
jgi:trimethylamine:corrinoid methyltransferase-like protein